ncbi:YybH family protein [Mycolicibacterium peregrinum]|nr:nuclear transport factor 2 family protein [Mycolicibacterium peregrinum]
MNAEAALRRKVDAYLASIDAADSESGKELWETSERVSFIHPRGHEYGWDEVAKNFYGITMGATFSQRALRLDGEPRITVYNDAAVIEFEWTFVALRVDNGETLRSVGRESQVFIRAEEDWKLVHVHYSGPPVTGAGQGF